MGSRTEQPLQRKRAHEAVILDGHGGMPRRCSLVLSRRGIRLSAAGAVVAEVPWWAIESLVPAPLDEPGLRRIELLTDAGSLVLRVTTADLDGVLSDLAQHASRWRFLRRRPVHWTTRSVVLARAALARGSFIARLRAALDRWPGRWTSSRRAAHASRSGLLARTLARSLAPARQIVANRVVPPLRGALRAVGLDKVLAKVFSKTHGRFAMRPVLGLVTAAAVSVSAGATFSAALGSRAHDAARLPPVAAASGPTQADLAMAGWWGIAEMIRQARLTGHTLRLAAAKTPPPPPPPSVANEPPLAAHEVFGFVPYWTLAQQSQIDVTGFTTLAYFSVDASGDGSIVQTGAGWDGYESQDFANLVARAHAAGVKVVLTVECFTAPTLTAITSSPQASSTLAAQVLALVRAKNLDGVNIDFEGQGQLPGLTATVSTVARVLHAADPHYQVTVDTYASSASDPQGFYDVPALAQVADGLFVMSYGLNIASYGDTTSPLTSSEFPDATAAAAYAAAAPAAKVIFGVPYYGYAWPTTNGTLGAQATGPPVPVSDAEALSGGHPRYWDPVTQTAWTSYEVGSQWYEAYFTDPTTVSTIVALAQRYHFAGVGAWALGMDGNSLQMTDALGGRASGVAPGGPGPAWTTTSVPQPHPKAPPGIPLPGVPFPGPTPVEPPPPTTTTLPPRPPTTTTTTLAPPPPTTTTTQPPSASRPASNNQGATTSASAASAGN